MDEVSNKSQERKPSIEGSEANKPNIKASLSSAKLEIISKLECAERILREPAYANAVNSLSPKKLEIMSRFGSWYFERILRHPASVGAVNTLSPEKFEVISNLHNKFLLVQPDIYSVEAVDSLNHRKSEMLLSKLHVTWFGKILQNPTYVQAVNSLNVGKLEILDRFSSSNIESILQDPVSVACVNSLHPEHFEIISRCKNLFDRISIFQNRATVEAVNSLIPEKLEIMLHCESVRFLFRLLEDPTSVESVNSLTTKKFEMISKLHPLWFLKILQDPVYVEGVSSLSSEMLGILISKLNPSWFELEKNGHIQPEAYSNAVHLEILVTMLHAKWFRRILGDPASTEAVNSLGPEKFEIINKLYDVCFETLFQDPASIQGVNSLSTAKLSAVIDIIKVKRLRNTILDASTIQNILDVDIERNIRFISLLENKSEHSDRNFGYYLDRNFGLYLDNKAICEYAIDVIDLYDFTANERVLTTVKNVVHLVFLGNKYDYWTSRLQELSLFESLKQL